MARIYGNPQTFAMQNAPGGGGANLVRDIGFENGPDIMSLAHANVSVATDMPNPLPGSTHALRFAYPARGGNLTLDGNAESRFTLPYLFPELTIEFDWYIPANYVHRDATGPDNNKLLRVWPTAFGDAEMQGLGTEHQSDNNLSRFTIDYQRPGTSGMTTGIVSNNNFITPADVGQWMHLHFYYKPAIGLTNGEVHIYKNNIPYLIWQGNDNNEIPQINGFRGGYLMGHANSGYAAETIFYIDNLRFWDGDALP